MSDSEDYSSDDDMYNKEIESSTAQHALRSFYDQYLKKNRINIQPEYQREFVWNGEKQNLFIDSIMRKYIIPQFILIKTKDDYAFECIDGQHRFTVIKHFITGEKLNGNYVRWRYKDENNKTINVFYEENENTKSKNSRNKRYFTDEEKEKFDSFELSLCKITSKLEFKDICTIFNRLQNGERTTNLDRLRNNDHPLSEFLRKAKVGRSEEFKKTRIGKSMWKIFNINGFKGKSSSTIKKIFSSILLRYVQISVKGIDNITSYLDLNMFKDIETKSERVSVEDKTIKDIIVNTGNFVELVATYFSDGKLEIPMFNVLADIYNKKYDGKMSHMVFLRVVESKTFDEYNNVKQFSKKSKIPTPKRYIEVRNEISKLFDETELGLEKNKKIKNV